jgi:diguanylate cyclase (GGDEF)-like protein
MGKQLLIVDDSPEVHALVKAILANDPVEVHSAMDPLFGLTLAQSLVADLILLDVDMPQMEGYEFCKRLKSSSRLRNIPVIFLTSKVKPDEKIRGLNLGAVDYICKPFHRGELLARIRSAYRVQSVITGLEAISMVDALTGLGNSRMFAERFRGEVSERARSAKPLTCTYITLDGFQVLRKRSGEAVCEQIMKAFGEILKAAYRSEDAVCRNGEWDFMILTPDTTVDGAYQLAEALNDQVSSMVFAIDGSSVAISCSIGIAGATTAYDREMPARAIAATQGAALGQPGRIWGPNGADWKSSKSAA